MHDCSFKFIVSVERNYPASHNLGMARY